MNNETVIHAAQKNYEGQQKSKGLIRVTVWIPAEERGGLLQHAKQLVSDAKRRV